VTYGLFIAHHKKLKLLATHGQVYRTAKQTKATIARRKIEKASKRFGEE